MISEACRTPPMYVLDQDSAKEFYTEKLGFEVRSDVTMGAEFEGAGEGFRWLTVGPPDQPDMEIILAARRNGPRSGHRGPDPRPRREGRAGRGRDGAPTTARRPTRSSPRGVVFTQEPARRPYGIEAVFRDDSGNWFSLSQTMA